MKKEEVLGSIAGGCLLPVQLAAIWDAPQPYLGIWDSNLCSFEKPTKQKLHKQQNRQQSQQQQQKVTVLAVGCFPPMELVLVMVMVRHMGCCPYPTSPDSVLSIVGIWDTYLQSLQNKQNRQKLDKQQKNNNNNKKQTKQTNSTQKHNAK